MAGEYEDHRLPPAAVARPVVVVGAGPTGLTAALELSRFGVPVRIVDRLIERSTTSRALAVQARTLELLSQRGVGDQMMALGNRAEAVTLFGDAEQLGRLDLTNVPSRHNFILMLSQAETERLLEEQLASHGVSVERGVEMVAVNNRRDPDAGALVVLRDRAGALEEVEASYVIAADGSHSTLRTTSNLSFKGNAGTQRYALGDLSIDSELSDSDMSIFIGRRGFLAAFPMGGGRFRFIATDPSTTEAEDEPSLAELQSLYDEIAHVPARMYDLNWSSRFWINSRMVSTLHAGNVFFGGDAAHIHSPAGGQGMNTGIQDMINLCWKLALVSKGLATRALLDTYDVERLAVIKAVVSTTERVTDALNADSTLIHRGITVGASILLGFDKAQSMGPKVLSQTGADYRHGPLADRHHASSEVRPGDRVPDDPGTVRVLHEGPGPIDRVPLYDLLDPSGFTLFVLGDARPSDLDDRMSPWPVTVRWIALADDEDNGARSFGGSPVLVLVRPDAYAAVVADVADVDRVERWLQTWLPLPARPSHAPASPNPAAP